MDRRRAREAKGRLVVNVDTFWNIRERNDVDVVAGIRRVRPDGRRFDKAREAFSIALDCRVHPVANGNVRTSVREASVNVAWDCVDSR